MFQELSYQITVVSQSRDNVAKALEAKDASYSAWVKANKTILDAVDAARKQVADAEAKLREIALKVFQETGNKQPAPGVGIRERTILDYKPELALAWAIKHGLALCLDKKAFENIAKSSPPDFVTILHEPQATISPDLRKASQNGATSS